jgi:hypothetical protein
MYSHSPKYSPHPHPSQPKHISAVQRTIPLRTPLQATGSKQPIFQTDATKAIPQDIPRKSKQDLLPRNLIEQLVLEEIDRQLQGVDSRRLPYLNSLQIAAYTLNRLPGLYVTSERGWERQMRRLENEGLAEKIQVTVQQAIVAVQRDPLREVSLVAADPEMEEAAIALSNLRQLLGNPKLEWYNLTNAVSAILKRESSP